MTEELEQVPSEESSVPDQSGLQSEAEPVVVELLDDYWFFRNCLRDTPPPPPPPPPLPPPPPPPSKAKIASSYSVKKEKVGVADQGKFATGVKIRKVLRVRSYDSMEKLVSSSRINFQQPSGILSKELKNFPRGKVMKAQKSVAELEHEEVQGFEDLGFVFDKERLSPVLMKMIPGLSHEGSGSGSDCGEVSDRKVATRPYLSERWITQRSTPSVVNWVGRKLAPDVKEQLQLWAKSVACNKACV